MRAYTRIFKADHDKALELGPTCLLIFLALCRIQSDAPPEKKGLFQAGAARVMRHCGLSRRAVQEGMKQLAAEGIIEIISGRRKDRKTDHEENQITLLCSAQDALGSARKDGMRCARKKKDPKGSKKEDRPAGRSAVAAPAGSQEENIHPDFDIY